MSTLDEFFHRLKQERPFHADRVSEPSPDDTDVRGIHAGSFRTMVYRANQVRREQQSMGLAVLGEAGVGKSHLLSRFWRWSQEDDRAIFVFLHNVLAAPDRLPRYLLQSVISVLTNGRRDDYEDSLLFRLFRDAMVNKLHLQPGDRPNLHDLEKAFDELVPTRDQPNRELLNVLLRVFMNLYNARRGEHYNPALIDAGLDWLSGDEIDSDSALKLGIRRAEHTDQDSYRLPDEQGLELVFRALTELAQMADKPFLLCLDQVDNLESDCIATMMRFLHVLLDHCPNLLVIVSGVRANMLSLVANQTIPKANWDRVGQYKIDLRRISPAEAHKILQSRIERVRKPYAQLDSIEQRLANEPLFPLSNDWFEQNLGTAIELGPRQVISFARDAWEAMQRQMRLKTPTDWLNNWPYDHDPDDDEPKPIFSREEVLKDKIKAKLAEAINQRKLNPGSLPADAGNLVELTHKLLSWCIQREPYTLTELDAPIRSEGKSKHPTYQLTLREKRADDGAEMASGLCFITTQNANSSTAALKRLVKDTHPPQHRILITDEDRRPLKRSPKAQEHLEHLAALGEQHFRHIKLNLTWHAKLDAMVSVVALARVGDLDIEYPKGNFEKVSASDAIETLHHLDEFSKHPLLHEFLTEAPATAEPSEIIVDRDKMQTILLERLKNRPDGVTTLELLEEYRSENEPTEDEGEQILHEINKIAEDMHDLRQLRAQAQDAYLVLHPLE